MAPSSDRGMDKTEVSAQEASKCGTDERKDDANNSVQTNSVKTKIPRADKVKFAGLMVFFVLVCLIGVASFPYFKDIASEEGRLALAADIQGAGPFGVLIMFGLQLLQIIVAVIPGEVVQLVAGVLYGTIGGSLIIILGALVSSIIVFYLVRKLGAPFVQAMISEKQMKKLGFLYDAKKLNTVVFVLFLIPGMPKDVLTYIIPLTKVKPADFFVLSTIGRIPGIVASTYAGASFISGNYVQMIVVFVIAGGLGLLGIIFKDRIMRFFEERINRLKKRG